MRINEKRSSGETFPYASLVQKEKFIDNLKINAHPSALRPKLTREETTMATNEGAHNLCARADAARGYHAC